jgi:hypothetical protein
MEITIDATLIETAGSARLGRGQASAPRKIPRGSSLGFVARGALRSGAGSPTAREVVEFYADFMSTAPVGR